MGDLAVITGAAGGIGTATAKAVRSAGYDLLLIDRSGSTVADLARPLEAVTATVEGSDLADCRGALAVVEGPVYALVHLAGVMEPDAVLAEDPAVWQRAMTNNLDNAYAFATAMTDRLPPGRMGRLVFASSIAFRRGSASHVAYSAAKAGLVGMTRALARRLRKKATVNAVCPGVIMTNMSVPLIAEAKDRLLADIPLGRFGAPEEVAGVIRFLLGWEAGFITGQAIGVDGGQSMS